MNEKFRKKPVVIEAVQWRGDNLREVIAFTGRNESAESWTWDHFEDVVRREGLMIFTLEGKHLASVGDYIIKGVHGEFYPCKPDIFAKTYEPAGEALEREAWTARVAMLVEAIERALEYDLTKAMRNSDIYRLRRAVARAKNQPDPTYAAPPAAPAEPPAHEKELGESKKNQQNSGPEVGA